MKILIYVFCFIILVVILTAIKTAGYMLGAIPSVLLWCATWWGAKKLCELWENIKHNKQK